MAGYVKPPVTKRNSGVVGGIVEPVTTKTNGVTGGRIVLAVDFGTTFSAIGYAFCRDGMEPQDIDFHIVDKGWPGQGRRRSPKIPSVFKLSGRRFQMGFEIEDDPDRISFSKLLLDPSQLRTAQQLANFAALQTEYSQETVMHGITMYLMGLKGRALESMKEMWGDEYVAKHGVDSVLSIPAIWSERAKANTMECAFRAGLGSRDRPMSVRLVSEPEAAAAYAITTLPDESWKVGMRCLLVDAGGGTVDLTTYRIAKLQPRLELTEEVVGDGALCGSTMLNMRFKDFINAKLRQEVTKEDMNEILVRFNDEIKPSFDGGDEIYSVEIPPDTPDDPAQGIEAGSLVVTAEDLKEIFDPVVQLVLNLVQCQLAKIRGLSATEKIPLLLVGGFGSSSYLRERIQAKFLRCQVLQPPDAWSAVVRGALLRTMVKTRKIRAHYGVMCREKWDSSKHEGQGRLAEFARNNKRWDPFEGTYTCANRMAWYVKKGDEFDNVRTVKFPFYQNFGIHHPLSSIEIELWAYLEANDGEDGPSFKDLDCHVIAYLRPDLSKIDRSEFPRLTSPSGEEYLRISYDLAMTFDNMIEFKLEYKGRTRGDVDARYVEYVNYVEPERSQGRQVRQ